MTDDVPLPALTRLSCVFSLKTMTSYPVMFSSGKAALQLTLRELAFKKLADKPRRTEG